MDAPEGTLSRRPRASLRSNTRAAFVSRNAVLFWFVHEMEEEKCGDGVWKSEYQDRYMNSLINVCASSCARCSLMTSINKGRYKHKLFLDNSR